MGWKIIAVTYFKRDWNAWQMNGIIDIRHKNIRN